MMAKSQKDIESNVASNELALQSENHQDSLQNSKIERIPETGDKFASFQAELDPTKDVVIMNKKGWYLISQI